MHGRREEPPGSAIARMVRDRGITDAATLRAIARFPRERFLPPETRGDSSLDRAVPIGLDQTISQPYIVGVMTAELKLTGIERVLEVGTGSGYQAAILSVLASEVFTIERHAVLSLRARGILDGLGITNVRFAIGDGSLGLPEFAPYDRILMTAAAPALPPALFEQLVEGGILVAPIGDENGQQITVVTKRGGAPQSREVLACRFVKLVGEAGWSADP
jgi:protein-L-isoaspartate(D-aspartate) O-methyltransferase